MFNSDKDEKINEDERDDWMAMLKDPEDSRLLTRSSSLSQLDSELRPLLSTRTDRTGIGFDRKYVLPGG